MMKQATDCACGSGAVRTRSPLSRVWRSKTAMRRDAIEAACPARRGARSFAQPDWLRQVPTGPRLPDGARVVFTGCGTSFHAAQTGGLGGAGARGGAPPPEADLLVCVSHEGDTPLTLEAARAFAGPKWLVTGDGRLAARGARRRGDRLHAGDRAVVVPHGELHVRGRGDRGAARRGRRRGLPDAVAEALRVPEPAARRRRRSSSPAPAATGRPRRRRC